MVCARNLVDALVGGKFVEYCSAVQNFRKFTREEGRGGGETKPRRSFSDFVNHEELPEFMSELKPSFSGPFIPGIYGGRFI